jgi:hypothetical protein
MVNILRSFLCRIAKYMVAGMACPYQCGRAVMVLKKFCITATKLLDRLSILLSREDQVMENGNSG